MNIATQNENLYSWRKSDLQGKPALREHGFEIVETEADTSGLMRELAVTRFPVSPLFRVTVR